jgi:hypothetical protein
MFFKHTQHQPTNRDVAERVYVFQAGILDPSENTLVKIFSFKNTQIFQTFRRLPV